MHSASSRNPIVRKMLLSAAAVGLAAALPAPAFAGGHGRHHGHHGGYYHQPHHYSYGYYPSHHHYPYYSYHHHRGHISAGEGALIAAGIIGGVILIDRALDSRDRYDDRRYDDNYRRGAFDDDYYYQRDDRAYDDGRYSGRAYDRGFEQGYSSARLDRDADDELLGDDLPGEGHARPQIADAAFRECVAETRGAAGAGGMRVAMPGAPTEVEELADGSVRLTAQFRASNARGEQWTRRFVCEADDEGVRFLQVD